MTKTQYRINEYCSIVFGSMLTALSISIFTAPAKIVGGGASGIAIILHHLQGWDIGLVTLAINIPLFFIGVKVFGNQYGVRSFIGTVLLSGFISLFDRIFHNQCILDLSKDTNFLLCAWFFETHISKDSPSLEGRDRAPHPFVMNTSVLTRLLVRDAFLSQDSLDRLESESILPTEAKSENNIDRLKGVAGSPRSIERAIPGLSFSFEMILRLFTDDNEQEVVALLKKGLMLTMAKDIVRGKIHNEYLFMQRVARQKGDASIGEGVEKLARLRTQLEQQGNDIETIRGIEGAAANAYFSLFAKTIQPDWAVFHV